MATGDFIATLELSRKINSSIFIDKTNLIPKLLLNRNFPVCFVRPRRFGKSFTMTMLTAFCRPSYQFKCLTDSINKEKYYDLVPKYGQNDYTTHFKGGVIDGVFYQPLKISQDKGNFQDFHANIPVLHISFRKISGDTQESLIQSLKTCIIQVFQQHNYLAVWNMLNILRKNEYREERELVYSICSKDQSINTKINKIYTHLLHKLHHLSSEIDLFYQIDVQQCKEFTQKELETILYKLILLMRGFFIKQRIKVNKSQQKWFHQKILVLVDQFDACILHLLTKYFGQQDPKINAKTITMEFIKYKAADLITRVLSSLSKDVGNIVHNCYMAGVTESLLDICQSGINSTDVASLGSKVGIVDYRDVFGFTQEQVENQVKKIMKNKKMPEAMLQQIMAIIKSSYNGYGDGNLILYNPWSVVKYLGILAKKQNSLIPKPDIYWERTGRNGLLRSLFLAQQSYSKLSSITLQSPLRSNRPLNFEYRSWGPIHFIEAFVSGQTINENILFFLLVRYGYLVEIVVDDNLMGFRIPNQEVSQHFQENVHKGWLYNIMGKDISNKLADQMLSEFSQNFFDLRKFQNTLRYYLRHIQGDKSQISLSAAIYGILHMGLVTKHFQSYVQIQYNVNGKRIDAFLTPRQNCAEKSVVILQCKVNKTKKNKKISNYKYLDDAEWQVYLSNYLQACSAIPKQKVWTNVIVRSAVFWQQNNGSWDVEMRQRKIPADKYKCITNLFTLDKLRQISKKSQANFNGTRLRAQFLQRGQQARQFILNFYNQFSLDNLIKDAILRQRKYTDQQKWQIVQELWVARAKGTKNFMVSKQNKIQMAKNKAVQSSRRKSKRKTVHYEDEIDSQSSSKRQRKSISKFQRVQQRKKQANSPSHSQRKRRTEAELLQESQLQDTQQCEQSQLTDFNHQRIRYSKNEIFRVTENGPKVEKVPPEKKISQKNKVLRGQIQHQQRQHYYMTRRRAKKDAEEKSLENKNQGQYIKQNKGRKSESKNKFN